jgi:hypothetical protein
MRKGREEGELNDEKWRGGKERKGEERREEEERRVDEKEEQCNEEKRRVERSHLLPMMVFLITITRARRMKGTKQRLTMRRRK